MKKIIMIGALSFVLSGCSLFLSPEEKDVKEKLPSYAEMMQTSDKLFKNSLNSVSRGEIDQTKITVVSESRLMQEKMVDRLQKDYENPVRNIYITAMHDRLQSMDTLLRSVQREEIDVKDVVKLVKEKDEQMVEEQTKRLNSIVSNYGIDPIKKINEDICIEECTKK
ncbi:hypothetical protein bcgnr5390_15140 [Bacillus luti]|nr:hypothetical protein BC2903_46430 [Bacillus cereus]